MRHLATGRSWGGPCLGTLLSLLSLACGPGNGLSGSVADILPLGFSQVVAFPSGTDLVVEYRQGADVICRLSLTTDGLNLRSGDHVTEVAFANRVSLGRATQQHDAFASIRSGQLDLNKYSLSPGDAVSGHFLALLSDGHTLVGDFEQRLSKP